MNNEVDISVGYLTCDPEKMKQFATPNSHYEQYISMIVKENIEMYLPWELFLLPFKYQVWIYLLNYILILVGIKAVFRRILPSEFEIPKSNNILYNFIILLCGGSVPPQKLRSLLKEDKIILISFIFGASIIRTEYQAKLFDIARNRTAKPSPDSFEEAIERGYQILSGPLLSERLRFDKDLYKRISPLPSDLYSLEIVKNSMDKKVFIFPSDVLGYIRMKLPELNEFHVMKQRVSRENVCLYLRKNSFLLAGLNVMLRRFRDHGFIEKWIHDFSSGKKKTSYNNGINLRFLYLFRVALYLYIFPILIFIFEAFSGKVRILRQLLVHMHNE